MRWLAQIAFVLLSASIANANTITAADTRAMLDISSALSTAIKDMAHAAQGMVQNHDFSTNETCLSNVTEQLMAVQADAQNLGVLFVIASFMIDARDEATALRYTDIAVDGFLNEAGTIRERMTWLSGVCSRFPLPVAKALQSVQLIDKAVSLAQSVSKRLKQAARP